MNGREIVRHLRQLLSPGQVQDSAAGIAASEQADWWLQADARAVAVAYPQSVEEIQRIVRAAGEHGYAINVVPNAAGNGAIVAPRDKPAVLLDLRRMNRILEVDADSAYALLEPGVRFDDLQAYLDAHELPFWIDADTNGANSVSGSICERSFGCSPYGDHLLMQCGMEVVLANGEVVRTGMGALPGNDTWQLFKYNFGPYVDGLFSRSDLAIVTKVGLWLMPQPPAWQPFMLSLDDDAALAQAVEVLRPLKISMVVPNTVIAAHTTTDDQLAARAGLTPRAQAASRWRLYGAIYGLPDNVALTWAAVASALGGIEGSRVAAGDDDADDAIWQLRKRMMRGRPAYTEPGLTSSRRLSFTVAAPMERESVEQMETLLAADSDLRWQREYALTWRTLQHRFELQYRRDDMAAAVTSALAMIDRLGDAGFAVTHDSPELRAAVSRRQTGDGLSVLYERLDAALDPGAVFRGTRAGG